MELSQYDGLTTNSGYLKVTDPMGRPLEGEGSTEEHPIHVTIELVSQDSSQYDRVQKRLVTEQTAAITQTARGAAPIMTGEKAEQNKIDLLVACTKGWVGLSDGGKPYPFTPTNARDLYQRLPFLREQVDRFVHDRGNFIAASS